MGNFLHLLASALDGPGLLLVALVDSSFLTIPEGNDFLIVLLSAGNTWHKMTYYVSMTIVGSLLGCMLLYSIGRKGGSPLLRRKFSERSINRAERLFQRYGMLTVVIPSILPPPCPFKVFVLSAGAFRLRWAEFLAAIAVGRTIRYFLWGILAVLYGSSVKQYMQQNLSSMGWILFGILLLILAVIAYFYFRRNEHLNQKGEGN